MFWWFWVQIDPSDHNFFCIFIFFHIFLGRTIFQKLFWRTCGENRFLPLSLPSVWPKHSTERLVNDETKMNCINNEQTLKYYMRSIKLQAFINFIKHVAPGTMSVEQHVLQCPSDIVCGVRNKYVCSSASETTAWIVKLPRIVCIVCFVLHCLALSCIEEVVGQNFEMLSIIGKFANILKFC